MNVHLYALTKKLTLKIAIRSLSDIFSPVIPNSVPEKNVESPLVIPKMR